MMIELAVTGVHKDISQPRVKELIARVIGREVEKFSMVRTSRGQEDAPLLRITLTHQDGQLLMTRKDTIPVIDGRIVRPSAWQAHHLPPWVQRTGGLRPAQPPATRSAAQRQPQQRPPQQQQSNSRASMHKNTPGRGRNQQNQQKHAQQSGQSLNKDRKSARPERAPAATTAPAAPTYLLPAPYAYPYAQPSFPAPQPPQPQQQQSSFLQPIADALAVAFQQAFTRLPAPTPRA